VTAAAAALCGAGATAAILASSGSATAPPTCTTPGGHIITGPIVYETPTGPGQVPSFLQGRDGQCFSSPATMTPQQANEIPQGTSFTITLPPPTTPQPTLP
jgi:hypothetical protein